MKDNDTRLKQLEAENLAMMEALKAIHTATECIGLNLCHVDGNCAHCFSQVKTPHTAAFAEYVQALEAVAEASKDIGLHINNLFLVAHAAGMSLPKQKVVSMGLSDFESLRRIGYSIQTLYESYTAVTKDLNKLESAASNYKSLKIPKTEKE